MTFRSCAIAVFAVLLTIHAQSEPARLFPRNTEVPFPWLPGATRSWPILETEVPVGHQVNLVARRDGVLLGQGNPLSLSGLTVSAAQHLTVVAEAEVDVPPFDLDVVIVGPEDNREAQTLRIQQGPPNRPISYIADFGDDLIRIFNRNDGTWAPTTRDAFDQYFRRCQLQGVNRLILWLSPMPYIADPASYPPEEWGLHEAQARALTESPLFLKWIEERRAGATRGEWGLHIPWDWIRQLNVYRLTRDFGPMIAESAERHGIGLTVSFRPFEPALTKYYEIPTFEQDGSWLWNFLPMATPAINFATADTCFAHYRTILREMGHEDKGRIGAISFPGAGGAEAFVRRFLASGDNLRIVSSAFAPLRRDSLVLQRQPDQSFALVPYGDFANVAEGQLTEIKHFNVRAEGDAVLVEGLDVPFEHRFLILSNPSDAPEALAPLSLAPARLHAKAGNALGREIAYWVLDSDPAMADITRIPGIPPTGDQATEFNAVESGYRHLYQAGAERTELRGNLLVIDLGAPWSVEMMDLNRPRMRENAVRELKAVLDLPAFDEIFISTRSHVQLAAYQGDGAEGVRPLVEYRENRKGYEHLGLDRAYAPLAIAQDPVLREWAADPARVERITTWQPGEWRGDCQDPESPFRWRYARNRAVADGVRAFLLDLESAFPETRIRAIIPMAADSAASVRAEIATLTRPDGTPYGPDNNGGVWSTINHIHSIGEGMAMVDLAGTRVEPVLFGVRDIPESGPFDVYLKGLFTDLAANRGSAWRGPRSFFFEAQYTLRRQDADAARAEREALMLKVLSHRSEVGEVLLYEAADWLYFLPFGDPALSGHGFLDGYAKE